METSVSRSTTHISLLNVDAGKWGDLSQKEQAEKIEKAMKGLSGSDRDEMKDQLLDVIADLTESVKESKKDLRKSRHRDKDKAAKRDGLVEELGELLLNLKDLKNDVEAADAILDRYEQTHKRDFSGGEDVPVKDLELGKPDEDPEKHTYTYQLGGQMAEFEENQDLSDRDYLLEQGVINQDGIVIKDVVKDDALNQKDIDEALKERNNILTRQKVFVRLKPGQRISLVTHDAESGEVVLKVVDEEGRFAFLRFEEAGNAVFSFTGGFTLDQARDWPEAFLKQIHLGGSQKSLHERFNPTTLSQEEKLAVIPGFTKIQHELNGLYGYTHATPDENLTWKAKEVIDLLYGYLDGGDLSRDKLFAVWEQINGMLSGLDEASRSVVLELAIVAIAKFSPQNFGRLFGPVVGRLEGVLAASGSEEGELSTGAKLASMLLETKAGPGNYGGGEIWKKYAVDKPNEADVLGKWKNKVSTINALRSYGEIVNHMDGRLPFDIEEMVGRVEGAYATAEDAGDSGEESGAKSSGGATGKKKTTPAKDHNPSFNSAKEEFESKLTWAHAYADHFTSPVHTNVKDWKYFIDQMAIYLFEEDGSLKKDPLVAVLHFLKTIDDDGADKLEDTDYDTLIAGLIRYVNWQLSAEFNNAFIPRMKKATLHWFEVDDEDNFGTRGRDQSLAEWILKQYPDEEADQNL